MTWRRVSNWAKNRPITLRLVDRLGRTRGRNRLLDRLTSPPPSVPKPNIADWQHRQLSAVWIGHATVLLRIGGLTVLTDPVLADRIGIGMGLFTAGPRRFVKPALSIGELPHIDLILVSHAHYDHLDRPTLCRLPKRIPILTSHHNADLIRDLGFRRVTEMRWGESVAIAGLNITARQVRHWGARTFFDTHRSFNAFMLEAAGRRIFFAGDTAYHDYFKDAGPVDLAIMGISAYDPYIQAHATPEQAYEMANHMRAERILPMHHSTFRLSHEPMDEPLQRIMEAAGRNVERLVARRVGDQWTL